MIDDTLCDVVTWHDKFVTFFRTLKTSLDSSNRIVCVHRVNITEPRNSTIVIKIIAPVKPETSESFIHLVVRMNNSFLKAKRAIYSYTNGS